MLEKYEPFWSDVEPPGRHMDRKAATAAHRALLAALPRKLAYFEELLTGGGVLLTGRAEGDLDAVGTWLAPRFKEARLSRAFLKERAKQLGGVPKQLAGFLPSADLDGPSLSICHYAGFFLSELVRKADPVFEYVLGKDRRNVDYNQTVLWSPYSRVQMESVGLLTVFAYKCIEAMGVSPIEGGLPDLYERWLAELSGRSDFGNFVTL